jgi:hypothetical protein
MENNRKQIIAYNPMGKESLRRPVKRWHKAWTGHMA